MMVHFQPFGALPVPKNSFLVKRANQAKSLKACFRFPAVAGAVTSVSTAGKKMSDVFDFQDEVGSLN